MINDADDPLVGNLSGTYVLQRTFILSVYKHESHIPELNVSSFASFSHLSSE